VLVVHAFLDKTGPTVLRTPRSSHLLVVSDEAEGLGLNPRLVEHRFPFLCVGSWL